jgi:hypothetical protein
MLCLSRTSAYLCEERKLAVLTYCSFFCFENGSLGTTKSNAGSVEAFEKIDRESVQIILNVSCFN